MMQISNIESYYPVYMGDNTIVYIGRIGHNSFLYAKKLNSTSKAKKLLAFDFSPICYAGKNKIAYIIKYKGIYTLNILTLEVEKVVADYRVENLFYAGYSRIGYSSILSSGNTVDINILDLKSRDTIYLSNISASSVCYLGNNRIAYSNNCDLGLLYLRNFDQRYNKKILDICIRVACYAGDDYIVYHNSELFVKSIKDKTQGIDLNIGRVHSCCAVGNGELVYSSSKDCHLYYINIKNKLKNYENSIFKK